MIRRLNMDTAAAVRGARVLALGAIAIVFAGMRPAAVPADVRGAAELAEIERAIAAGDPVTLDWKAMSALNYHTGEM
ncbi:MAG: hypothetical protein KFH98_07380, partial [Gemmatimonadetes bacterium]|nr:hypothetical protein [Gemmatimonadota bacterium]